MDEKMVSENFKHNGSIYKNENLCLKIHNPRKRQLLKFVSIYEEAIKYTYYDV